MDDQQAVLSSAFEILAGEPRLVSVHSYKATSAVVEVLERYRPPGVILPSWLGTEEETVRAVEAGAFFSLNSSQLRRWPLASSLPRDRVVLETDHPFGDRQTKPQRPGNLTDAETRLGKALDLTASATRRLVWQNLKRLVDDCPAVGALLPREFQVQLLAL
jgi:TatD DNase family protein